MEETEIATLRVQWASLLDDALKIREPEEMRKRRLKHLRSDLLGEVGQGRVTWADAEETLTRIDEQIDNRKEP